MIEELCTIRKRHGAYLIMFNQNVETFSYCGPDDLADVASSLELAKRIAKTGAKEAGCTNLRWVEGQFGWELHGKDADS